MQALCLGWQTSRPAKDISVLLFLCSHKSLQPHPLVSGFLLRLESSLIGGEAVAAAAYYDVGSTPHPCPLGILS